MRTFAVIGHVSPKTASVAKRGERLRKSTINTLTAALSSFLIKCQESPNSLTGRLLDGRHLNRTSIGRPERQSARGCQVKGRSYRFPADALGSTN